MPVTKLKIVVLITLLVCDMQLQVQSDIYTKIVNNPHQFICSYCVRKKVKEKLQNWPKCSSYVNESDTYYTKLAEL